jgi:hypothetical protein
MSGKKTEISGIPVPVEKSYTALVCGDGRILPIVEYIGRRVIREIDPRSREGRALLESGFVALWREGADAPRRVPLGKLLEEMKADVKAGLAGHPGESRWLAHQRGLAKSLTKTIARARH